MYKVRYSYSLDHDRTTRILLLAPLRRSTSAHACSIANWQYLIFRDAQVSQKA